MGKFWKLILASILVISTPHASFAISQQLGCTHESLMKCAESEADLAFKKYAKQLIAKKVINPNDVEIIVDHGAIAAEVKNETTVNLYDPVTESTGVIYVDYFCANVVTPPATDSDLITFNPKDPKNNYWITVCSSWKAADTCNHELVFSLKNKFGYDLSKVLGQVPCNRTHNMGD